MLQAELEDAARARVVAEELLELRVLDPGGGVCWVLRYVLFVERARAVEFAELCRHKWERGEERVGGRTSVSSSIYPLKNFSFGHIPLAVPRTLRAVRRSSRREFCECEEFVGDDSQCCSVDLPSTIVFLARKIRP